MYLCTKKRILARLVLTPAMFESPIRRHIGNLAIIIKFPPLSSACHFAIAERRKKPNKGSEIQPVNDR